MRYVLIVICLVGLVSPVSAQSIKLDIDISQAERLLEIACSDVLIDEKEWT